VGGGRRARAGPQTVPALVAEPRPTTVFPGWRAFAQTLSKKPRPASVMKPIPMTEPQSSDPGVCAAFARYGPLLTDYASRILGDRDRAADVVQETFLRMCRETRAGAEVKIPEWLYTVCRNQAIDVKRKERRMFQTQENHVLDKPSREAHTAAAFERKDSDGALLGLLGRLPENQGEVLRLRFQHELTYKQIADVTGLSVSNVGFLIHTGLKSLRARFASRAVLPGLTVLPGTTQPSVT